MRLQTLCQKDDEVLQKLMEFDTSVNIVCRFTVEYVFGCSRETWAVCSHEICASTADFDGGFAYNGEHTAALC